MVSFKQIALIASMVATSLSGVAAEEEAFSYVPNFHGAIRSRLEMNTESGDYRFQVRNARLSLDGKIAPSIDYYAQLDLCDQGQIKFLDAWGRFRIIKGLSVQAGQFRMPFGVEPFRAPSNYIFANTSFMGNQIMNYRAVGAKVSYTLPKTPLTFEFGAFNPAAIEQYKTWHNAWYHSVAYAGKALWKLPEGFSVSASYGSIKPYNATRANLIDGFISWENKNWLVVGEYMFEKYCHRDYKDVHSYLVFADWHKPVSAGVFNQWSIQARLDGMTDHYALKSTDTWEGARHRATIGSTLTFKYRAVHADVRVNYEKYFKCADGATGVNDCVVAELVVRF